MTTPDDLQITAGKTVSIRYLLKNSKGEILENGMDGPPVTYLHGSGTILPSLEAAVGGLKAGDAKTILVSNGQEKDDFTIEVIIDRVHDANGAIKSNQGDCGPDCIC